MPKSFAQLHDRKVKKFLDTLGKRIDSKKLSDVATPMAFADFINHFENERGPESKWEKWSDSYTKHMKKIGRSGNKILQFSGRLRKSFLPRNTNYKKYSQVKKFKILWYNNQKTKTGFPYAAAHNNDEPRRKLPQRKFMWLSDRAFKKISKAYLMYLAEGKK